MEREAPAPATPEPGSDDPRGPLTEGDIEIAERVNSLVDYKYVRPREIAGGRPEDARHLEVLGSVPSAEQAKRMDDGHWAEWAMVDLLQNTYGLNVRHATRYQDDNLYIDSSIEIPEKYPLHIQLKTGTNADAPKGKGREKQLEERDVVEDEWRNRNLKGVFLVWPLNPEYIKEKWIAWRNAEFGNEVVTDEKLDAEEREERIEDNRELGKGFAKSIMYKLLGELQGQPDLRDAFTYLASKVEAVHKPGTEAPPGRGK